MVFARQNKIPREYLRQYHRYELTLPGGLGLFRENQNQRYQLYDIYHF